AMGRDPAPSATARQVRLGMVSHAEASSHDFPAVRCDVPTTDAPTTVHIPGHALAQPVGAGSGICSVASTCATPASLELNAFEADAALREADSHVKNPRKLATSNITGTRCDDSVLRMSRLAAGPTPMPNTDNPLAASTCRTRFAAEVKTVPSVGSPSVSTNNHGR